uniref:Uncharacterized protein n=1 Tax=Anguilla anguilla TaxID=7936 RepID=A0A0E9P7A0_ANGAN
MNCELQLLSQKLRICRFHIVSRCITISGFEIAGFN